ncbi:Protein of unknown function [Vibrio xiamenensis]|uniref:DUF3316 domain-containing protein n=1 Tax=Vibrio xiamenensis TaxID=861298 RepID=A0A1G8AB02_9VIBR|nr:DUF3316 domain-containing protein [Vibrio xiamenensis]SDH18215.1 Protein of unknown function [Vibrio xiamenensis]
MKTFILLSSASVLAVSAPVLAAPQTQYSATTFQTQSYSDKNMAYQAGHKMMNKFSNMSAQQLREELPILEPELDQNSVDIKDMNLQVQKVALESGKIQYRAIVDVDYNYTYNRGGDS